MIAARSAELPLDCYGLLRAACGRILAGYALDSDGTPSWWAVSDGARRRRVSTPAQAQAAAETAASRDGWTPGGAQ